MLRIGILVAVGTFAGLFPAAEAVGAPDRLSPGTVDNQLVFSRPDSSRVQFASGTQTLVWCAPWEDPLVPEPSLRILIHGGPQDPRMDLRLVLADVTVGTPDFFPNLWTWPDPHDVDIFVYDSPNELTTNHGAATGSILFQELDCGPPGAVRFVIDAVLASEFGGGLPLRVQGTLRADVIVPTLHSTWGTLKARYR